MKILVVSHNTQRLCALRWVYIFNHLMIHSYFACWLYEFEYAARINTHTANTLVIPLYRRFLCSVRWIAVGKIETTGVHSEWTQLFSLSVSWNYLLRFVSFEKRVVLTNCYFFSRQKSLWTCNDKSRIDHTYSRSKMISFCIFIVLGISMTWQIRKECRTHFLQHLKLRRF